MLLEVLSEVIGIESAISLAIHYQGERLYIPHVIGAEHEIADILGMRLAAKLAVAYGGESLAMPTFTRSGRVLNGRLQEFQKDKIREAKALGFSRMDCVKVFRVTRQMMQYGDRPENNKKNKKKQANFAIVKKVSADLGCEQLSFGI